jgi:hypothetical protein
VRRSLRVNDVPDDPDVPDDGDDEGVAGAGPDLLAVAARELIGAARRVLDAVEQVVDDPESAKGAVASVGDIVRQAARVGASFLAPQGSRPTPDDDDDEDDGGVQFIRVD